MTTTKQSTAEPCAYFMQYIALVYTSSVCRTGPDKMADILQTPFPSSFLFENMFILAEDCFNSFPGNKSIFWATKGLV